MRIIGGRDYYDTALSFGHDPHTVYVRGAEELLAFSPIRERKAEETAESLGILPAQFPGKVRKRQAMDTRRRSRHSWRSLSRRYQEEVVETAKFHFRFSYPTVIACGKRYDGVRVDVSKVLTYGSAGGAVETLIFWHFDHFCSWMEENQLQWWRGADDAPLEEYFVPKPLSKALMDVVVTRRWTILAYDPVVEANKWRVDQPVLRNLQFFKAVDPNTMFQEIDMWVSGVLSQPAKPTVEISDDIRAAKHGMDKTSFRKPKQE